MPVLLKLWTAAVLGLALAAAPVAAQDIHIDPVPLHVKPQWTPVPNVPGTFYAPICPPTSSAMAANTIFIGKAISIAAASPGGPGNP